MKNIYLLFALQAFGALAVPVVGTRTGSALAARTTRPPHFRLIDTDDKLKRGIETHHVPINIHIESVDDGTPKRGNVPVNIHIESVDDGEEGEAKRKLISPYTQEVDAADPHAVLGE